MGGFTVNSMWVGGHRGWAWNEADAEGGGPITAEDECSAEVCVLSKLLRELDRLHRKLTSGRQHEGTRTHLHVPSHVSIND